MADAGQDGGGLLGDLPSHRPSVRSPRRNAARAAASRPPKQATTEARSPAPSATEEPGGAEQLIRTGAGLALAPARLGLRIAGRAVDGLGRAVGRN